VLGAGTMLKEQSIMTIADSRPTNSHR
jgi:hypothetical protein